MKKISAVMPAKSFKCNLWRLSLIVLSSLAVILGLGARSAAAPPPGEGHAKPHVRTYPLDPSFDPNSPEGGVPFCPSGLLCYPPGFLKKAYNFPPTRGPNGLDGRDQTIVIVDAFGSPTMQSDLDTFNTTFGLPPTTVEVLCGPTWTGAATDVCPVNDLTFAPPCFNITWAEETTLDVDMAHAMAPAAKIVLVVANDCQDVNLNAAEFAVVTQKRFEGSIMSQSFGEPEDTVGCPDGPCAVPDPTIKANADRVYRIATHHRWTLIASSGDAGANEDLSDGITALIPSWPATNPLVLAAGGTQGNPYGGQYGPPPVTSGFSCAAHELCNTGLVVINGGRHGCQAVAAFEPSSCFPVGYGGEAAWNEYNIFGVGTATGGGVSSLYRRPEYQEDVPHEFPTLLGSTVRATGRLNPDVSFNASINGGLLSYLGFLSPPGWVIFGGTSAASPAWAGIIALLNQANGGPVGFITPQVYDLSHRQRRETFHDITVGNNSDTNGELCTPPAGCSPPVTTDGFLASPGYDLTTGWGSPDVSELIKALVDRDHGHGGDHEDHGHSGDR